MKVTGFKLGNWQNIDTSQIYADARAMRLEIKAQLLKLCRKEKSVRLRKPGHMIQPTLLVLLHWRLGMKSQLIENVLCFAKWILCICLPWAPYWVSLEGYRDNIANSWNSRNNYFIAPLISTCSGRLAWCRHDFQALALSIEASRWMLPLLYAAMLLRLQSTCRS